MPRHCIGTAYPTSARVRQGNRPHMCPYGPRLYGTQVSSSWRCSTLTPWRRRTSWCWRGRRWWRWRPGGMGAGRDRIGSGGTWVRGGKLLALRGRRWWRWRQCGKGGLENTSKDSSCSSSLPAYRFVLRSVRRTPCCRTQARAARVLPAQDLEQRRGQRLARTPQPVEGGCSLSITISSNYCKFIMLTSACGRWVAPVAAAGVSW